MSGAPRSYFPAFIDISARLCVVIGGGSEAERKVKALLRSGARDVVVIAPEFTPGIIAFAEEQKVSLEHREYKTGDLERAFLVICADASDEVATAVQTEAAGWRALVQVVGRPDLSNYLSPSLVRRGPLQIAVTTSGTAPEVAKRVRRGIQEDFGEAWGRYATLSADVRALATARVDDADKRKAVLDAVAASNLPDRLAAGEDLDAEQVFKEYSVKAWFPQDGEQPGGATVPAADSATGEGGEDVQG